MLKASPEKKKVYKNNSQPDWQGMYEELASFLQSTGSQSGTPSEAYSWLMESVDVNGKAKGTLNGRTWMEDIVRVQDKIKDEVEEWCLSIVQDLLMRQACPYSVYELKNFGIDLNAVVAAIRAAESKFKITAKEKPSDSKLLSSPECGGTGEHSPKQVPPPSDYSSKGRKPCDYYCNGVMPTRTDQRIAGWPAKIPGVLMTARSRGSTLHAQMCDRIDEELRIYNVKYRFPRNLFGITIKEWGTVADEQTNAIHGNKQHHDSAQAARSPSARVHVQAIPPATALLLELLTPSQASLFSQSWPNAVSKNTRAGVGPNLLDIPI
ncbi:hypothetical protein CYMTET_12392 [Cymbomonas tetramitiformis]|uniref:Uncharacterized protein n=1 Tax=Cymbomonas tetramitiformis TaxID=36881 RepID=A0AAE0LBW2_9CHLO|nr:hypothetical protein CYMTET_12392 [Cymbomonas tetramitiformis]